MRVFIGLTEVAGYYRGLREGFAELGVDATFVNLTEHRFGYGGDDFNIFAEGYKRTRGTTVARLPRYGLFAWAAARFDVFIFGFGSSLLGRQRDFPILKRMGKTIICQFHGSDSRPAYVDGSIMAADRGISIAEGIQRVREQKAMLRNVDRYADVVVNIPPQAHLHERPFVNWMRVGLPSRPRGFPKQVSFPDNETVRVLHSPSHPLAKGSDRIRAIVATLKGEGLPIELIELTGLPNAEVLRQLERADIVVDQMYADYAMPGFATEAAWYGRPVVIGGYATELWEQLLPPEHRPATRYCHPDAVEGEIRNLACDRDYRRAEGARARAWIEAHWHPRLVAQRYLDLATKPAPEDWLIDPKDIRYWQGCCLSEDGARGLLRTFIDEGGTAALQIDDKPALIEALVRASKNE